MNSERQLLIAGLPGSGKTTFLALLFLALIKRRTVGLKLAHYEDDRVFLNQIAKRLERGEIAIHTELGEDRELSLTVLVGDSQVPATLRIPDLSGETWKQASLERHWPVAIDDLASSARGLLLFVHTKRLHTSAEIGWVSEVAALAGFLDEGVDDDDAPKEPNTVSEGDEVAEAEAVTDNEVEDSHEATSSGQEEDLQAEGGGSSANAAAKHVPPPQVQVVDFLQLICEQRAPKPARVAFVFSAWDEVDDAVTPADYLQRNLPLVDQYISSNRDWLEFACFGLSAQGGDFVAQRDELLEKDPVTRAIVKAADGANTATEDIILWALGSGH